MKAVWPSTFPEAMPSIVSLSIVIVEPGASGFPSVTLHSPFSTATPQSPAPVISKWMFAFQSPAFSATKPVGRAWKSMPTGLSPSAVSVAGASATASAPMSLNRSAISMGVQADSLLMPSVMFILYSKICFPWMPKIWPVISFELSAARKVTIGEMSSGSISSSTLSISSVMRVLATGAIALTAMLCLASSSAPIRVRA